MDFSSIIFRFNRYRGFHYSWDNRSLNFCTSYHPWSQSGCWLASCSCWKLSSKVCGVNAVIRLSWRCHETFRKTPLVRKKKVWGVWGKNLSDIEGLWGDSEVGIENPRKHLRYSGNLQFSRSSRKESVGFKRQVWARLSGVSRKFDNHKWKTKWLSDHHTRKVRQFVHFW